MTTTDQQDPWEFFDLIGVTHLERFLDEGADFVNLGIDEEEVTRLATSAAVRWHGPRLTYKGEDAGEQVAGLFFYFVTSVMFGQHLIEHPDGRVSVESALGEVEVTDERLRHWQWMLVLFTMPEVAGRFLDAVPSWVRERAMGRATSAEVSDHALFLEIVYADMIADPAEGVAK